MTLPIQQRPRPTAPSTNLILYFYSKCKSIDIGKKVKGYWKGVKRKLLTSTVSQMKQREVRRSVLFHSKKKILFLKNTISEIKYNRPKILTDILLLKLSRYGTFFV